MRFQVRVKFLLGPELLLQSCELEIRVLAVLIRLDVLVITSTLAAWFHYRSRLLLHCLIFVKIMIISEAC